MKCPECAQVDIQPDPAGYWGCTHCGASGHLENVNCPSCGMILPSGAERCPHCGKSLSIIDNVLLRPADQLASTWLEEARNRAEGIKTRETLASEKRMQTFQAMDEARIRADQQAMDEAHTKERTFIALALVLAVVFFAVILIAAVIMIR